MSQNETRVQKLAVLEGLWRQKRFKDQYGEVWKAKNNKQSILLNSPKILKNFRDFRWKSKRKTEEGVFDWRGLGSWDRNYFEGEPAWEYVKDLPIQIHQITFRDRRTWLWMCLRMSIIVIVVRKSSDKDRLITRPYSPEILKSLQNCWRRFSNLFRQWIYHYWKVRLISGRDKFQGASIDLVHFDEDVKVECFWTSVITYCGLRREAFTHAYSSCWPLASGVRTPWGLISMMSSSKDEKISLC